jgi:hypothetical protein
VRAGAKLRARFVQTRRGMRKHLALFVLLSGCAAAGPAATSAALNAGVNTAVAAGVAGARRSQGECYTPCTPGNACNPKTGYCEPLPCGGGCPIGQACDAAVGSGRCVPASDLEVHQATGQTKPTPPPDVPAR